MENVYHEIGKNLVRDKDYHIYRLTQLTREELEGLLRDILRSSQTEDGHGTGEDYSSRLAKFSVQSHDMSTRESLFKYGGEQ